MHDFQIEDLSQASFPFNFLSLGYVNDLKIELDTFSMLNLNSVLRSKIVKVEL
jgi:hypothetical protein